MLGCALALLLTADPAMSRAPRTFAFAPALAPFWLIAEQTKNPTERRFPAPEYGSQFNMYAESGGLQVGPGLRTDAYTYSCNPSERPQCKIGRPDISLPKNLGPLIGLSLHMTKLVMTESRNARGIPPPRQWLLYLLNALPIINLSFLDRGVYSNLLFVY